MFISSTEIENKITNLTGIDFELFIRELASEYFSDVYSRVQNIEHVGKQDGTKNPAQSVYDLWCKCFSNEVEHNIFFGITSQKSNKPFGKGNKVEKDISSIAGYIGETGPYKNAKIIYAINSKVDAESDKYFAELCKKHDIDFAFWGLGTIVNMTLNSPRVLGLYFPEFADSGSMIGISEFMKDEKNSSEFGQSFRYRDKKFKDIYDAIIGRRCVALYGHSGCGKTRMAIELGKALHSELKFDVYFLKRSFASILDEIKAVCSRKKEVLLIVDDANKIPYLLDLFNYAYINRRLHLLLTVRDYAFVTIKERLLDFDYASIELSPLSNEEIENILAENFPNISNKNTIKYIVKISKSNLRFAIITAKVVCGEEKRYNSLSEIVEAFYKSLLNDIGIVNDRDFENFLCAISFFGQLDTFDKKLVLQLSQVFNFNCSMVPKYIELGDEKEIFETDKTKQIVNVSDQIFATYICYRKIYKDHELRLVDIFNAFFNHNSPKVISLVQSILDLYRDSDTIKTDVREIYNELLQDDNYISMKPFLDGFHNLLPNETMDYVSTHLLKLNKNVYIVEGLVRLLLTWIENDDYYQRVVNIFIDLLRDETVGGIIAANKDLAIGIKRQSIFRGFKSQIYFLDKIIQLDINNPSILAFAVKSLLPYEHEEFAESEEGNLINIYHFKCPNTNSFSLMREKLWHILDKLIHNGCFNLISQTYQSLSLGDKTTYDLRLVDWIYCKKTISGLDLSNFSNSIIAFNCLMPFRKMEEGKEYLERICKSNALLLYKDYFNERTSKRLYGDDLKKSFALFYERYSSFEELFEDLSSIQEVLDTSNNYKYTEALTSAFDYVEKNNPDKYTDVLINYFNKYDVAKYNYIDIFKKTKDIKRLYYLVSSNEKINNNPYILSPLFLSFNADEIDEEICKQAFAFFTGELFTSKDVMYGNENILSLREFNKYKPGFIKRICNSYLEKDLGSSFFLEHLFNHYIDLNELFSLFENDKNVLKLIYRDQIKKGRLYDSGLFIGRELASNDDIFFEELVRLLCEYKYEYHYVKELFADTRFPKIFVELFSGEDYLRLQFSFSHIIEAFSDDTYVNFLNLFIELNAKIENLMFRISGAVSGRGKTGRLEFLKCCIRKKVPEEILERIEIMNGPHSWSGNFSTYLKDDIQTFEAFINSDNYDISYKQCLLRILNNLKKNLRYYEASEINNPV